MSVLRADVGTHRSRERNVVVERKLPRLLRLEGIVIVDRNRVLRGLLFLLASERKRKIHGLKMGSATKLPVTGAPVTVLRTYIHSTDCQH